MVSGCEFCWKRSLPPAACPLVCALATFGVCACNCVGVVRRRFWLRALCRVGVGGKRGFYSNVSADGSASYKDKSELKSPQLCSVFKLIGIQIRVQLRSPGGSRLEWICSWRRPWSGSPGNRSRAVRVRRRRGMAGGLRHTRRRRRGNVRDGDAVMEGGGQAAAGYWLSKYHFPAAAPTQKQVKPNINMRTKRLHSSRRRLTFFRKPSRCPPGLGCIAMRPVTARGSR